MAEIQPFRAYRYDARRVALKDVLTQPYDKISPQMQDKYYAASPYNLIPVEKGRTLEGDSAQNNVYSRAAQKIQEWIAERVLVQDSAPAIYVYTQEFQIPGSQTRRTRSGFISLVRVEDYDAKVVFRHEHTLSGPKADRIELLRRTGAQTGQLFFLYEDPARQVDSLFESITKQTPAIELNDEYDTIHRVWPVTDKPLIEKLQKAMADKSLIIADGHHRYETALNLRNEARAKSGNHDRTAASEFAMATIINAHSKGLTILPTHRVVRYPNFDFENFRRDLSPYFDSYSYPFQNASERASSYGEFRKNLESHSQERHAIGVYPTPKDGSGAFYLFVLRKDTDLEALLPDLSPAQRTLDVVLLHRLLLEKGLGITAEAVAAEKNITYEREMGAAIAHVDRGEAQLTCLLNPARIEQVAEIALGGDVMPQKSTDFYPKLLSGLTIYKVEGRVG
ncbi:MAG: DUF1015 domain-containing protein [Candidatus Acidiferrales bacterium]